MPDSCPEVLMAEKVRLTDRKLKALKPAKSGERYELMDTEVSGFGVRVTDKGRRSFILLARYPGGRNPTRRALGQYPSETLADAREKARQWRKWIDKGVDPKDEEERQRLAELRKRADTFDEVAEDFIKRVLPKQRRGEIVAREIRREFSGRWKARPITSIDRRDVIAVINEAVDRGANYQAHNLFGHVRALFNWAIEVGDYGLETSPCDRIRPKVLIGKREPRQRVLDDVELKAFWVATGEIGYPFGPLYRLLLLTGARKNEIAHVRWRELDLKKKRLTVPPERFKSNAAHLIPLTDEAIGIIEDLPEFERPDFMFSTSFGTKPVTGFAKAKDRLDWLMTEELGAKLKPWRTHDLRRTVRTRLAGLRVADTVAEMIIGHGRRGIQRVYDQHTYAPEMREALELWAGLLRDIVNLESENVVQLQGGEV